MRRGWGLDTSDAIGGRLRAAADGRFGGAFDSAEAEPVLTHAALAALLEAFLQMILWWNAQRP
jgi:hypothetical protein